jgi:hypothetical protein
MPDGLSAAGTVTEAVERRDAQEVAVEFIRHGPKRLLASLAAMDVIEPSA